MVDDIKSIAKSTHRPEVIGGLGGFGALCKLPTNYNNPVLVAGTDGVGTKLKLALDTQRHEGVGIDLVAMCVNDLVVAGAEPLFFLDYYATAKLDVPTAASVVASIGEGCRQAGAALIGGETAEMPGMYAVGDYDLAGFCVGVVEEDGVIDGSQVAVGDSIIALGSSGPHSNGYSLIRQWLGEQAGDEDTELRARLLTPTRIYKELPDLWGASGPETVHAMAHITGGGLPGNLVRILPDGLACAISCESLPLQVWMRDFWERRGKTLREVSEAFNLGVGMVLVVEAGKALDVQRYFSSTGQNAVQIGEVCAYSGQRPRVLLN